MSTSKIKIKVACIQTKAGDNFNLNLKKAKSLVEKAIKSGASLIALPEMFLYRGSSRIYSQIAKESQRAIHEFQDIAKKFRVAIFAGSILEKTSQFGKYYNTSFFISKSGAILARYRKIHLFDVRTPSRALMRESKLITPGRFVISAKEQGIQFGLSICFDLRFPDHYQMLTRRGAQVIFVPSNFLYETGKAHWHALLRARAIENQAFIVAPAQAGTNPDSKFKSFGHSMMVGPWGEILAEASGSGVEVITANFDLNGQARLRGFFPILKKLT